MRSKLEFFISIAVCNVMVWGMFTLLNVPHLSESQNYVANIMPAVRTNFMATSGKPVRVTVPDLGIDETVRDGTFDPKSSEWSISDNEAYYAVMSQPANDSNGATLLYGHARANMFEPLQSIQPSTLAYVYTDNSKVFVYKYSMVREVLPTNTDVFSTAGSPTLVLQTCSGPWDRYRSLYTFDYVEFKNA